MQIKSIFKRKVLNLVLFWKWEFSNSEMSHYKIFMHKILILYPDLLSVLTLPPRILAKKKNWIFFLTNLALGFVDERSGYEINKISDWMVCINGIKAPQNSTALTT